MAFLEKLSRKAVLLTFIGVGLWMGTYAASVLILTPMFGAIGNPSLTEDEKQDAFLVGADQMSCSRPLLDGALVLGKVSFALGIAGLLLRLIEARPRSDRVDEPPK